MKAETAVGSKYCGQHTPFRRAAMVAKTYDQPVYKVPCCVATTPASNKPGGV